MFNDPYAQQQTVVLPPKIVETPGPVTTVYIPPAMTLHKKPDTVIPPTGCALSRPCMLFAMLLLLAAVGLGIAAAAGKSWLKFGKGQTTGWDMGFGAPPLSRDGQMRMSHYKIYFKDNGLDTNYNLLSFLDSYLPTIGQSTSYLDSLRHSVRVCRAFIIIGIVFAFFAALMCLVTALQCYSWQSYRKCRFIAGVLAMLAFAGFVITFIVWLVITQTLYVGSANVRRSFLMLKCSGCGYGWPVWLTLASFILAFVASLIICFAFEPKNWRTRRPKDGSVPPAPPAVQVPTATQLIRGPPPTPNLPSISPVYVQQPVVQPEILSGPGYLGQTIVQPDILSGTGYLGQPTEMVYY